MAHELLSPDGVKRERWLLAMSLLPGWAVKFYAGQMADREQLPATVALDALRSAYGAAFRAIESSPDNYAAYLAATEVAETMRQLTMRAGRLRAMIAVRISDEEELSLADLAVKLNLSKTRAAQLVRKGRG